MTINCVSFSNLAFTRAQVCTCMNIGETYIYSKEIYKQVVLSIRVQRKVILPSFISYDKGNWSFKQRHEMFWNFQGEFREQLQAVLCFEYFGIENWPLSLSSQIGRRQTNQGVNPACFHLMSPALSNTVMVKCINCWFIYTSSHLIDLWPVL